MFCRFLGQTGVGFLNRYPLLGARDGDEAESVELEYLLTC